MSTASFLRRAPHAFGFLGVGLLAAAARADVLHVPGDFPTPAEALAAVQAGDVIVLAAGTYPDPILVDTLEDITIRGQGKVVLSGGTAVTPAITLDNSIGVTLERVRVEGALGTGVLVQQCTSVTLRKLHVTASAGEGILTTGSQDVTIERCRVEAAGGDGIAADTVEGITISRCTVIDADGAGIALSNGAACLVERCRVTGIAGGGINLGTAGAVFACRALRNVVELNGIAFGIEALGAGNTLERNRVSGCSGILLALGSTGGQAIGNTIIDCNRGILCFPSGALLQDNRAVKPFLTGFVVEEDDCVLLDNRALQAGARGFQLLNSVSGGSVTGCKALHSGTSGFDIEADEVIFIANSAKGSAEHGFVVGGSSNQFLGNSAPGNALGSLLDEGSGNVYFDNDFGTGSP